MKLTGPIIMSVVSMITAFIISFLILYLTSPGIVTKVKNDGTEDLIMSRVILWALLIAVCVATVVFLITTSDREYKTGRYSYIPQGVEMVKMV